MRDLPWKPRRNRQEQLVGDFGAWEYQIADVEDLWEYFEQAQKELEPELFEQIFKQVVVSHEPSRGRGARSPQLHGSGGFGLERVGRA